MIKKESFFIEMLDDGFVLKNGNSKKAIESSQKLEEEIVKRFIDAIGSFTRSGILNMVISFEVDENVPQAAAR
ncbi:MAG: hypothetical protein M9898_02115 [Chitinophagaceae bacterium]|nr:hypothetical protein [Chitinophagaceae bacterium]